jgi:hypothetical protein
MKETIAAGLFFLIIYVGFCYMLLQILYVIGDKMKHLTGADQGFTPIIAEKIEEIGKHNE